ncbi:30S ribosomal protein S3 [Candidatus Wolfebacteria bacterium]|nr:30S ribosomal protein S3 [Candidatus Wolfebacteria bacterium]
MAHKINPKAYRVGVSVGWSSRWFSNKKNTKRLLEEDTVIRKVVDEKIKQAGIDKVDIERSASNCKVLVKVSKPGLVIGRGGKGIEELTSAIQTALSKVAKKYKDKEYTKSSISVNVEEVKRTDVSARVMAQQIAWDLEKRMKSRRTMKRYLQFIMNNREVQGAKITVSGRLDGSEIARSEWLAKGKLPLTTLRANIDYGEVTAYTTYGTIGVKVWIYKGEF